jgi:proteasome assembly chaperone (PAC2) family protein
VTERIDAYVRSLEDLGGLELRRPYAVMAFGGWIDGSWAATNAVRYLLERMVAPRVAELDPEPFYSFTDTRPRVVLPGGGRREVRWRQGRWHAARTTDECDHDLVLFIGPEPNLRWRTFTDVFLDVLQKVGTEALLTMGTVLAPMHYRRRVPIRGWATNQEWRARLRQYGIMRNTYEGPTGIATVVSLAAQERGMPAMVLTASTPSYLASNANPKTSLGLLRAVSSLLDVSLPLTSLEQAAQAFDRQVDQYLDGQPELRTEIEALAEQGEEDAESAPEPGPTSEPSAGELPRSEDVVRDLEAFLKNLRESQEDNPPQA